MIRYVPLPTLDDNYTWILRRPGTPVVAAVDPGEASPVLDLLEEQDLQLRWILVTHHHHDHVGGVSELARGGEVDVVGPLRGPASGRHRSVGEGERIELDELDLALDVWHTPGHTADHVCYLGRGLALTGDTLFAGGCGRLFEGSAEEMHGSLERLASLPGATEVCCAHEYTLTNLRFALVVEPDNPEIEQRLAQAEGRRREGRPTVPSTIELERRTNPFLRCSEVAVRAAAESHAGRELASPVDVFAVIRSWKDGWRSPR